MSNFNFVGPATGPRSLPNPPELPRAKDLALAGGIGVVAVETAKAMFPNQSKSVQLLEGGIEAAGTLLLAAAGWALFTRAQHASRAQAANIEDRLND